jgi:hypothetical protein
MPQFLVPSISKATTISVASYDFVDQLLGKTLTKQVNASNVATLKLDRAHGKEIGDHVYINGLSTHLEYNGYFVISAVPTPESFSYALTHAADAENADTGGVVHDPNSGKQNGFFLRVGGTGNVRYQLPGNVTAQMARRAVATNVATVTTRRPHGLLVGNTIVIYGAALAAYNNTAFTITAVPTPTTFTFSLVTGDHDVVDGGGIIFDTIVKSFTASTVFNDPELIKQIFTLSTAATGLVVGFSKDQRG